MSETMKNTVPALQRAMKQMDAAGIGNSVEDFEKVFEDMEVKTGEIDSAMENIYQGAIAQDEVQGLLDEVSGEQSMQVAG